MGRFSFMPPRSGTHWFRVGTVDVTTTVLVTALGVISLILFAVSPSAMGYLGLISPLVTSGQLWRLATWPFLNFPGDGLWIVVALLVFWYFGQSLEQLLGRTRFVWFLALLTVVPALVITAYAVVTSQFFLQPGSGMFGLETAVIVAYTAAYPNVRSFFGVSFWVIALVFIGINALQLASLRAWAYLLFLLLECIAGMLAARTFGLSRISWIPAIPLPAFISGDSSRKEERKRRKVAHLHVVRDNDINTLLDKIAEQGINSLTKDERRRLDEHSRHARD